MRPVEDPAVMGLCLVLWSTSNCMYLKNAFKGRSMSKSHVRINLCCWLFRSPDVLSKGQTVLSKQKVFSGKNPTVSWPQCTCKPPATVDGRVWVSRLGGRDWCLCVCFLSGKASLQELFAVSVSDLVFDFGEACVYVPQENPFLPSTQMASWSCSLSVSTLVVGLWSLWEVSFSSCVNLLPQHTLS